MPCQNCSPNAINFQCGDPPRLICVRSESDPVTIPAWVSPVCTEGNLTGLALFSDEAGTVPLVGYTYANRVPCPANLLGTTCAVPLMANLCPATMVPLLDAIDSAGEEIETAIAAQTVALQGTAESVGEEIEQAIAAAAVGYNSVGAALPANFDSLPQTLNYTGENLTSIVVTNGVNTWTQTFTYTGANLTGISAWVQT